MDHKKMMVFLIMTRRHVPFTERILKSNFKL